MRTYPFPALLVQQLVDYLATKPFNEVANFMAEIQTIVRQAEAPPEASAAATPRMTNGNSEHKNV